MAEQKRREEISIKSVKTEMTVQSDPLFDRLRNDLVRPPCTKGGDKIKKEDLTR